ncbi:uncharacterized protein LOC115088576 [Rhinatrema bivittatum]|uniref:uncharacterized protein LOC115088576 n=1 Tax=Rhinatrema bivittatum TaxID=194408 RepID=UPI00112DB68F|nr:uncharacterized protein LOC115088576 [Rhinatrema bivittatum]
MVASRSKLRPGLTVMAAGHGGPRPGPGTHPQRQALLCKETRDRRKQKESAPKGATSPRQRGNGGNWIPLGFPSPRKQCALGEETRFAIRRCKPSAVHFASCWLGARPESEIHGSVAKWMVAFLARVMTARECILRTLEELTSSQLKAFRFHAESTGIPRGRLDESQQREALAELLLSHFGRKKALGMATCILERIPRRDLVRKLQLQASALSSDPKAKLKTISRTN